MNEYKKEAIIPASNSSFYTLSPTIKSLALPLFFMRILFIQHANENSPAEYSNFIKQAVIATTNKYNKGEIVKHIILNKLFYKNPASLDDLVFTIEKKITNKLLMRVWYNVQLPAFIRKQNINVVIHSEYVISKKIAIPQYILLDNIFNVTPMKFKKVNVKGFIVYSQFAKEFAVKHFKINEAFIKPVSPFTGLSEAPLSWEEKEKIKNEFTEGDEYFLIKGIETKERFIYVLKAFSKFKKWQQSKMNIIMLLKGEDALHTYSQALSGYKYFNAVKLLHAKKENEETLLKASYAFIHDSNNNNNFFPVYNAFKKSISVIAPYVKYMDAFTGKPVLYYKFNDLDELSQSFINIYKDEPLRNKLILEGLKEYQKNVMPDAHEKLWQMLTEGS